MNILSLFIPFFAGAAIPPLFSALIIAIFGRKLFQKYSWKAAYPHGCHVLGGMTIGHKCFLGKMCGGLIE